jgi:hypothetical protein
VEILQAQMVFLPGAVRLAELHAAELPQKDDLCGAFWGALALRAAGVETHEGAPLDQDAVALAAGSTISASAAGEGHLPAGETGRRDYRLDLPVGNADASGTSAGGVARAVEGLSGGALVAIPVRGPWTSETVRLLIGLASSASPLALVANLWTGALWGSRPSAAQLLSYLCTGDWNAGPAADWSVGHFVALVGAAHGPEGTLVAIADTYPSLGWQGLHLQPTEAVAAALARDDGREGGVLALCSSQARAGLEQHLRAVGFRCGLWDNGSADVAA